MLALLEAPPAMHEVQIHRLLCWLHRGAPPAGPISPSKAKQPCLDRQHFCCHSGCPVESRRCMNRCHLTWGSPAQNNAEKAASNRTKAAKLAAAVVNLKGRA